MDAMRGERSTSLFERRALLAVEIVAACETFLIDPQYGWDIVLLVVTAGSGAYSLSPTGSKVQVLGQSLLIGAGLLGNGVSSGDAALTVVVYGSFQAFAVLVVNSEQREAMARTDLAATNVELRATRPSCRNRHRQLSGCASPASSTTSSATS